MMRLSLSFPRLCTTTTIATASSSSSSSFPFCLYKFSGSSSASPPSPIPPSYPSPLPSFHPSSSSCSIGSANQPNESCAVEARRDRGGKSSTRLLRIQRKGVKYYRWRQGEAAVFITPTIKPIGGHHAKSQ
eukprot:GHVS01015371.1.p1 GENE.GHVS01015371.1~~GHVS01015371.1.p1  ORF type:complete len:131 (-),score=41.63 GHVS01015371.1:421-813(-)